MSALQTRTPRPLPAVLSVLGGLASLGHLAAVGMLALAAPSGPWPTNFGVSDSPGPQFATATTMNVTYPYYLEPLRMTHNYHFRSNNVAMTSAYFQVHLKDQFGTVTKTLKFPDEKANFWVRHRQSLLAQGLAEDQPAQSEGTERIGPAGNSAKRPPAKEIWEPGPNGVLLLKGVDRVPADRPVFRPSPWSKLLAQSYLRYLCREHNAASAELVRHSREAVMPVVLFMPPAPESFHELQSNFGEYRREK